MIVVNGHRRGNLAPLEIAVNQMRQKTGAAIAVVDVGIIAFDKVAEIRTTPPGGVGHADELETSHALHMYPHLVNQEKAKPRMSNPNPDWMTAHHITDPGGGRPPVFFTPRRSPNTGPRLETRGNPAIRRRQPQRKGAPSTRPWWKGSWASSSI